MPWPEKQRRAIFLDLKRHKGEEAAKRFMRRHGYGKQGPSHLHDLLRK